MRTTTSMHESYIENISSSHHVIYAGIALTICFVLQLCACANSRYDSGRLYDTVSGLSVALACISAYFIRGLHFERQTLATTLVCIWGVRLSAYLRARTLPPAKTNAVELLFPRLLWGLASALPTVLCNLDEKEYMTWSTIEQAGFFMAIIGLTMETIADEQKRRWFLAHTASRPSKDSRETPICSNGLWSISRHPNFFGEICFQFGVFLICADAIPKGIIVCPFLIALMLLVFDGGLLTQEQYRNHKYLLYPSYLHYKQSTSLLIPCPPPIYRALGAVGKKVFCLQFSCYDEVLVGPNEV